MSTPAYSVFPIRFSTDLGSMIMFLETLGLHKAVDHDTSDWAVFEAASGRVAVHGIESANSPLTSGDTWLNFAVADVVAAAEELSQAGLSCRTWDETHGKQGVVRAPDGRAIGLNEQRQEGLSDGYQVHEQTVAASLDVVAVWYSVDFQRDAAFFSRFGFEPFTPIDNPWWCALRGGRRQRGVVGLHAPGGVVTDPAERDGVGSSALVRLGFETSEPLDALATRLRASGHDSAKVVDDEAGTKVVLSDPDGQHLEIHPTV